MPSKIITLEGYILSSSKYRENDSIIVLLTSYGKKNVLVRGGEKPDSKNHQAIIVFNKVKLDVNSTNEDYLSATSVETEENNSVLYENLIYSSMLQFASEILLRNFQDDDSMPYSYFEQMIHLSLDNFDSLTLMFIFLCQATSRMGFEPNINECVNCGSKKNLVSFDLNEGGFICSSCAEEIGLEKSNVNYMKVFRYGFMVPANLMGKSVLPKDDTRKALTELAMFIEDQFGGSKIKTLKLYLEMIN